MPAKKRLSPPKAAMDLQTHPRIDFIRSVKFGGLGLDRCDARVDRVALSVVREGGLDVENNVSIKQYVLAHGEDFFVVAADFELVQQPLDSDQKIVSIAATFSAKFDLTTKANEELIRSFANLEARLVFFPYLRHFVSDMSYRMSIDPIVLPLTSELEQKSPA